MQFWVGINNWFSLIYLCVLYLHKLLIIAQIEFMVSFYKLFRYDMVIFYYDLL